MEQNTQMQQQPTAPQTEAQQTAPAVSQDAAMHIFSSKENFNTAWTMATTLASSTIVPVQFQKSKTPEAVANCLIALEMSNRIGASPLMVMQNLYVVYGNVGWSSRFLIATLNTCGKFTPIRYEQEHVGEGEAWRCRAWAIDKVTNVPLHGAWVSIKMAKDEGWYDKNGSKWKTMPELMLQYRAAAFFQRTYAPELSMGMHTKEEYEDMEFSPYEDLSSKDAPMKKFDISKIKTEEDINKALLWGQINKDEADYLRTNLTKEKAASNIIAAVERTDADNNKGSETKLFPDNDKQ